MDRTPHPSSVGIVKLVQTSGDGLTVPLSQLETDRTTVNISTDSKSLPYTLRGDKHFNRRGHNF